MRLLCITYLTMSQEEELFAAMDKHPKLEEVSRFMNSKIITAASLIKIVSKFASDPYKYHVIKLANSRNTIDLDKYEYGFLNELHEDYYILECFLHLKKQGCFHVERGNNKEHINMMKGLMSRLTAELHKQEAVKKYLKEESSVKFDKEETIRIFGFFDSKLYQCGTLEIILPRLSVAEEERWQIVSFFDLLYKKRVMELFRKYHGMNVLSE
jgi:hypothetical protein